MHGIKIFSSPCRMGISSASDYGQQEAGKPMNGTPDGWG